MAILALLFVGIPVSHSQQQRQSRPSVSQTTKATPGKRTTTKKVTPLDPAALAREEQEKQRLELDREAADAAERGAVFTGELVTATDGLTRATDRLGNITCALVGVGGVQAAILIAQLLMFLKQLRLMRQGTDDTATAARAALVHANAVVAAEIGEAVVVAMNLVSYPDAPTSGTGTLISGGPIPEYSRVVLTVHNLGRTRVITLTSTCLEWAVIPRTSIGVNPDPPVEPSYTHIVGRGLVVQANQTIPLKWSEGVIKVSLEHQHAMGNDLAWLWVFGYFTYRDFFSRACRRTLITSACVVRQ